MRYISTLISSLTRIMLIWIISFVWLNDVIKNSYLAITFSILISVVIELLLSLLYYKKDNKEKLTKEEKQQINDWKTQLQFMSNKQICDIYKSNTDYEIIYQRNKILIKNGYKYITPIFDKSIIGYDDIVSIYKYAKSKNITELNIHCLEYDDNANQISRLISDINITLCDINYIYKNIIKNNDYTNRNFQKTITIKDSNRINYLDVVFNKKIVKNYIFSGILLLFASFFTKYSLLYEITGSILLIFSLICILRKNKIKS